MSSLKPQPTSGGSGFTTGNRRKGKWAIGGGEESNLSDTVRTATGATKTATPPPRTRGLVKLWSSDLGIAAVARHKDAPQVIQERAGGWQVRERPGQLPRTWRPSAGPLLKVRMVLLLDGWTPPTASVQPDINALRRLAGIDWQYDPARQGPVIQVIGAIPATNADLSVVSWVIDRLDIDEELHLSNGAPCRATATVELLEYNPSTSEVRRTENTRRRSIKWKKGDTLHKVAKRELGATTRAAWIRDANPKIKNWAKVEPGKTITIPAITDRLTSGDPPAKAKSKKK